jgi:Xaa-Pro aminopeptidase
VAERERRLGALRAVMDTHAWDALLIGARGDEFMRGRLQYVSDAYLWGGWGFVVLPRVGPALLLADPLAGFITPDDDDELTVELTQDPARATARFLAAAGSAAARIGVAGLADIVSAAHFADLQRVFPGSDLLDATDAFDAIRAVKSEYELSCLAETSAVLRAVFDALGAEIRPGVDERDMLSEAHRLARQFGCLDGIAMACRAPAGGFGPGVGGVIGADDVIVIDLEWGGPSGFWVELRRTFSFAPPPVEVQRYFEARVATFEACAAAMVPGASSQDLLAARDRVDAEHGLSAGEDVRYSAHGIGLDSLEPPWVPGKPRVLEQNMVLSLHPNAVLSAEQTARFGAISVSDNVLVAPGGGRRMTYETEEWVILEG